MNRKVKIIADSTCDLSQEILQKYDIDILPLHVLLGKTEYLDGQSITPEIIFKWSDRNKATPKTSAISMEATIDVFRKYLSEGYDLVCISISGKLSTTVNIMFMAAEELNALDRIHIVDSHSISTGTGLLVVRAAELAAEGKSAAEIAEYLASMRSKVSASFIVDKLTYLHRGGRCSGIAALAGNAFGIRPKIVVLEDGSMVGSKKYRGSLEFVLDNYFNDILDELIKADPKRVFITHSYKSDSIAYQLKRRIMKLGVFEEVIITRAGCVVSSHCGPNTLGILYMRR